MWDEPKVWRFVTGVVIGGAAILVGWGSYIAPRLNAGAAAVTYLNKCVEAKVCPTFDQLAERIKQNDATATTKAPVAQPPVTEKKN